MWLQWALCGCYRVCHSEGLTITEGPQGALWADCGGRLRPLAVTGVRQGKLVPQTLHGPNLTDTQPAGPAALRAGGTNFQRQAEQSEKGPIRSVRVGGATERAFIQGSSIN